MSKNLLVINVDLRETRVALIEDGIIAELHVERAATRGTLGNIVLGKVTRVLPGMQAAFIDIGLERAAFLHVEDLIRPDDFEAYLGGAKRDGDEPSESDSANNGLEEPPSEPPSAPGEGQRSNAGTGRPQGARAGRDGSAAASTESQNSPPAEADEAATTESFGHSAAGELGGPAAAAGEGISEVPEASHDEGDSPEDLDSADVEAEAEGGAEGEAEGGAEGGAEEEADARSQGFDDAEPTDRYAPADAEAAEDGTVTEVESASSGLPVVEEGAGAENVVVEVEVRTGSSTEPSETPAAGKAAAADPSPLKDATLLVQRPEAQRLAAPQSLSQSPSSSGAPTGIGPRDEPEPRAKREGRLVAAVDARGFRNKAALRHGRDKSRAQAQKGRGGRPRNGHRDTSRISRSTPIREVIREGQEIVVQVSKEPIGTKGARVTSHISLPGRYVVYMPTIDQIGISKRIGSDKERARLREAIESIKPPTGGLIVRTVAEGLTKKQLKADVGYLVRLWAETAKKRDGGAKAPTLLYQELDLVLKTARDLFNDEIEQIVIDDREQYQRLTRFVEMFMPERVKDIVLFTGDEPIFDAYGIEDEIGRALSRKVPLPSGGYLIIDEAEALTAIDVNTGRYVGKGSKDLEDTLYKTNLEAVEEIAYQLRFRNLGGLIVLDLIDMERASNREKIRRRLEELLQKDKAKTTLNRISDLGLIEMTRKRTRESLGRSLHEPCFYCDGTGQLQSKQTIVYEILRQMRRDRAFLPGYSVVVNAHPAIIDLMKAEEREAVHEAERRFMRRIELVPRKEYHLEQFDLAGK